MRQILKALAFAAALSPGFAAAQVPQFPQTLPANTVIGRLGIGAGPTQAIPLSVLMTNVGASRTLNTTLPLAGGGTLAADRTLSLNIGVGLTTSGGNLILANPSASTLGGVQSAAAVANQWINSISTSGVPALSQPAIANISGWGTGVAAALGINVGSAGAPVLFNGAGGTPSSLTLTNALGLPYAGLPSGTLDTVLGYFGSTTANAIAIGNCANSLTYSTSTHTFGCNSGAGTGSVTSAQISAGNGISVATTAGANPCIATCNLTVTNSGVVKVQPAQKITATGTYTPTTGMIYVQVECVGGGGGGGGIASSTASGAAGSGGSGAYSRVILTAAQIGASKAITIGAAGAGGTAGANTGGTGGDTSLGILCVAKGGVGGGGTTAPNQVGGGAGGLASGGTGDVKISGNGGGAGSGSSVTTSNWTSPPGASSFFGGGAPGTINNGSGSVATDCGGGGSGGASNNVGNFAGGAGFAGCVVITEFTSQ